LLENKGLRIIFKLRDKRIINIYLATEANRLSIDFKNIGRQFQNSQVAEQLINTVEIADYPIENK
jgi:hypothetical protein